MCCIVIERSICELWAVRNNIAYLIEETSLVCLLSESNENDEEEDDEDQK